MTSNGLPVRLASAFAVRYSRCHPAGSAAGEVDESATANTRDVDQIEYVVIRPLPLNTNWFFRLSHREKARQPVPRTPSCTSSPAKFGRAPVQFPTCPPPPLAPRVRPRVSTYQQKKQ